MTSDNTLGRTVYVRVLCFNTFGRVRVELCWALEDYMYKYKYRQTSRYREKKQPQAKLFQKIRTHS